MTSLVDRIDALLPQTQCTRCGYPSCGDYARAIAAGEAEINQCPPGGEATIRQLAALLERPYHPLNPVHGVERPRAAALIDESRCIGCTLCIQACPVDAIVGARSRMHTVLTEYCTGCELCLPPCPVDCIEMVPLSELVSRGHRAAAGLMQQSVEEMARIARARHAWRRSRLERERQERELRFAAAAAGKRPSVRAEPASAGRERKQRMIQAALERARARRAAHARRRGE
ncbi:MAG TPA: electron transport complex subunit RsxB [Burkholderiales bacterium]|jgi:electron transport complex protein RnfB|nr:electron transport complex subunit RsxB [Burkholderiales bacterium]